MRTRRFDRKRQERAEVSDAFFHFSEPSNGTSRKCARIAEKGFEFGAIEVIRSFVEPSSASRGG
jgi:hypothetical protein